jgi:hypothetical protein
MKLELTPWTVFLGILLFCKELTYTVCLRLILLDMCQSILLLFSHFVQVGFKSVSFYNTTFLFDLCSASICSCYSVIILYDYF